MLIVHEAIGFSGSLFRALGQKRGQIRRSHDVLYVNNDVALNLKDTSGAKRR
jgi:hypothetical protein